MFWADKAKFCLEYLVHYKENQNFKDANRNLALPPAYMMFESFNMNYQKYYEGGFKTAEWILDIIKPYHTCQNATILDWGCGPARITRHLHGICGSGSKIHGTDYNSETIRWCGKNIRNVTFTLNNTIPPLTYDKDTFDVIIGISVFTHLSEENHHAWIKELHRVIKPGGIAFITTHGQVFRSLLTEKERSIYDNGSLIVRDAVKEGHRVFTAFQPTDWMYNALNQTFEILIHHAGTQADWGKEQDYWIIKKS